MVENGRIEALRLRCIERKTKAWRSPVMAYAASLEASEGEGSWQLRRGRATRDILKDVQFEIDDLELLVGRLGPRPVDDIALKEGRAWESRYPLSPGGQTGHAELSLTALFAEGIDSLLASIDSLTAVCSAEDEKASTWYSFALALDGLSTMIENAATTARTAANATENAERRRELSEMAAVCEIVAHGRPETFRAAVQLLWFVLFAVQYAEGVSLIVPGRLDRSLLPFFEADMEAGRLTRDATLLLIESLYLLINEFVPDGLAVSVMVGGRDEHGRDVTNDLSYLCLEALRRTKLVYPTVGVCWHEGTPPELSKLAIDLIAEGYSTPAFFGDETIQRGLRNLGLDEAQSCNYINSTCVEITPVGCSNVWVASPYFNLCGMLLEVIAEAAANAPPTFDEFRLRYEVMLRDRIAEAAADQNALRRRRKDRGGKPLQSVFTRDCVFRGQDIDAGGALVNWVECSFVGLANLADSLRVVEEEVYRTGRLGFPELKTILDEDFAGAEALRLRFLNSHPKYGWGDESVDRFVADIVGHVRLVCSTLSIEPDGSAFVPGAFVWIKHEELGAETGATPDGRRAGEPFADGAGPAQGREKRGPTAAIQSTTSWDHAPLIGGVAFNMKFPSSLATARGGRDYLGELIFGYLRRGGFETQVNVVDRATLLAARKDPEAYRDLVVRIGGYTDYFTRLSPGMQDEIIKRTEYA